MSKNEVPIFMQIFACEKNAKTATARKLSQRTRADKLVIPLPEEEGGGGRGGRGGDRPMRRGGVAFEPSETARRFERAPPGEARGSIRDR